MFKGSVLYSLIALVLAAVPAAYAGRAEVTAYYPAPYGEYSSLNATSSFILPRMAADDRPTAFSNPPVVQGMMIFNTDTNQLEVYSGTAWVLAGGGGGRAQIATQSMTIPAGGTITASITRTFPGGMVYAFFAVQFYWTVGNGNGYVRLYVDGVEQETGHAGQTYYSATAPVSWAGNLTGSHTITAECTTFDGNTTYTAGSKPRLTVIY